MKEMFKKFAHSTKPSKLKIFSAAFSAIIALQASCMPVHAGYNKLMRILEESSNLTVEDIKPIVQKHPEYVKETDYDDDTVLYYALCKGKNTNSNRSAIAKYLISKGVSIDNVSHLYSSACYKGVYSFASWLLENYFYDFGQPSEGLTAAHWAARYDRVDDLAYIINKDRRLLDAPGIWPYETPLYVAAENGSARCVSWLLEHGANLSTTGEKNPMLAAIGKSHITEIMLRHQAKDPSFKSKAKSVNRETGDTPLHVAIRNGNSDETTRLLMAGANPNVKNKDGETPLHIASRENGNCWDLLEAGANPNIRDKNGQTPLHYADARDIKTLLDDRFRFSADVNAIDNNGNSPLQLFVGRAFDWNDDCVNALRLFVKKGADVKKKDENGRTLLHLLMIGSQNNSNLRGSSRWNVCRKYSEFVKELVRCGLDINAIDDAGCTPLDYCNESYIRELIKEQGAESNRGLLGRGLHKVTRKANSIIHFFD